MRWRLFWFGALSFLLAIELWAVGNARAGDTFSEQVIPAVLASPALWWTTLVAWAAFTAWLTWHLWFQYRDRR